MPILERDEKGKVVKSTLDPQKAKEMAQISHSRAGQVDELLEWAGWNPKDAPPDIRLLASDAVKSGRSPVTALRELRARSGLDDKGGMTKPAVGEVCQLCGQYYGGVDSKLLLKVLKLLGDDADKELVERLERGGY